MEVRILKVKLTELNSGFTGYSRVSRFSRKTQSKMIIAGVLVAVFVFVYILSSVGIIPFDALSSRFSSFVLQDSDNYPIVVNTDSTINTAVIGDKVLVLTTENFSVYSQSGKLVYSQPHSYASPAISVNGDKGVVFDRGYKSYMLINEKKVVYAGETSNPIICAEYGESGNYALGTYGDDSTSKLIVYSATNKVKFQWNCAYEHIVSIALAPNGKFAGVAVMGAENGEVFTCVKYFGFDYQEPLNSQTISGASAFDLKFTDVNILTLFADSGIFKITKKGETFEPIKEYYSSEFNSFDCSDNGKYVVALAKYGSANNFSISVYSQKGKEKANIPGDKAIKSVTMSDKYIFALAENTIMVYNLGGREITRIDIKGDARHILATDKYIFVFSLDKLSRCYSFGDKTLELSN